MSSLLDKQKKFEELQRQKKEREEKARKLKESQNTPSSSIGLSDYSKKADDLTTAAPVPKRTGPVREFNNFVGVFNLPSKQKPYMYDRSVEVNKAYLDMLKELEDEEKPPALHYKEDEDGDEEEFQERKRRNEKRILTLADEEAEKIMNTPQFKRFIRKGSEIMDSELSDNESLYEDRMETNDGGEATKTIMNYSMALKTDLKDYSATNLVWSRNNADLLLVTYNALDAIQKNRSEIHVWNMKNKLKPLHKEFPLNEKKVTRAIFHPKNDNIIFAATYSGTIFKFEVNEKPVITGKNLTIGENGEYHSQPIFVLEYFANEQGEYLISMSVDGAMCVWDINYMSEPQVHRIIEIKAKLQSGRQKLECIHPMCSLVTRACSEDATLYLGTFDSLLLKYNIANLVKPSEDPTDDQVIISEHHGPICAISRRPDSSHSFLNDLFLTASFDFEVQLWKIQSSYASLLRKYTLCTDYVIAVDWNPVHPTIFATCDCNGRFLIFDLAISQTYFIHEEKIGGACAMKWCPDGLKLAFALQTGEVQIWSMKKKYLAFDEEKIAELKNAF